MVTLKDRLKQLSELKQQTANQPRFVPPTAEEASLSSSEHIEDDDEELDNSKQDEATENKGGDEGHTDATSGLAEPDPWTNSVSSLGDKEIAAQYRKMLKMGMPAEAVGQKMRADSVDQKIIDDVLNMQGKANVKPCLR